MSRSSSPAPAVPSRRGQASSPLSRLSAASLTAGGVVLAASLLLNPGPDFTHVADPGWAAGHLLNGAAYLLVLLGLPALGAAAGRWLGYLGTLGLGGLMVHFALSSGSQLYYARVVPVLAGLPSARGQLTGAGRLANLYGGWRDGVTLFTAVASLALGVALWRSGRGLRLAAVLLAAAALGELTITPVALLAYVLLSVWLGLRLMVHGDLRPLRSRWQGGARVVPALTSPVAADPQAASAAGSSAEWTTTSEETARVRQT